MTTAATPVATTVSTVQELVDVVQHAAAHDTPLRLQGNATWLQGGGPFVPDSPLSLRAIAGIVDYEPGDLVITARAGTTLAELDAVTRREGQMLAIAPYGAMESTLGALVATATPAPLAFTDLQIRDLVLGLDGVTGTGERIRAGGRVVKNVAGFDLVRLQVGAWGTLGAITDVTLRLHAVPTVDEYVVGTPTGTLDTVLAAITANRAPLPMLVVCAPGAAPVVWARVSGNPERARALHAHLASLGVHDTTVVPDARALHDTPHDATVLRVRAARAAGATMIQQLRVIVPTATVMYEPLRGAARVVIPTADADASLVRLKREAHNTALSIAVDQGRGASHVRSTLEQRVKHALDPRDILNRFAIS